MEEIVDRRSEKKKRTAKVAEGSRRDRGGGWKFREMNRRWTQMDADER
jgi:hypothetical protein